MQHDKALRSMERMAQSGDRDAAYQMELAAARLTGVCPCGQDCPPESWDEAARIEVERDFDEHGGYRLAVESVRLHMQHVGRA